MHIISPKARIVCGVIATITSATLIGSVVLGFTSPEFSLTFVWTPGEQLTIWNAMG